MSFIVQAAFWPKWDGEGEPTGPVFWEEIAGPYSTAMAADEALATLAPDYHPGSVRVAPAEP